MDLKTLRDAKPCGRVLVPPRSAKNMSWEDCVVLMPPAADFWQCSNGVSSFISMRSPALPLKLPSNWACFCGAKVGPRPR